LEIYKNKFWFSGMSVQPQTKIESNIVIPWYIHNKYLRRPVDGGPEIYNPKPPANFKPKKPSAKERVKKYNEFYLPRYKLLQKYYNDEMLNWFANATFAKKTFMEGPDSDYNPKVDTASNPRTELAFGVVADVINLSIDNTKATVNWIGNLFRKKKDDDVDEGE
jgi:hypothetical protein